MSGVREQKITWQTALMTELGIILHADIPVMQVSFVILEVRFSVSYSIESSELIYKDQRSSNTKTQNRILLLFILNG